MPFVMRILPMILAVGTLPLLALGQTPAPSPYQGQQTREIKSLSAEDVKALQDGTGMGLAKAAELNEYPGPAHVLQLAEPLALSEAQRSSVQAVFNRMKADATAVGQRILSLERALDEAFAQHRMSPEALGPQVAEIARLQGELRTIHLRAHLETVPLLSMHQVHQYVALRGYGSAAGEHMHSMGGGHAPGMGGEHAHEMAGAAGH